MAPPPPSCLLGPLNPQSGGTGLSDGSSICQCLRLSFSKPFPPSVGWMAKQEVAEDGRDSCFNLGPASSTSVICGRRQTTRRLFKNTFEPRQYGEEEGHGLG